MLWGWTGRTYTQSQCTVYSMKARPLGSLSVVFLRLHALGMVGVLVRDHVLLR